jgi:hypothetical protein
MSSFIKDIENDKGITNQQDKPKSSRWSLLRQSISGGKSNHNNDNNISIHRFKGFNVMEQKKMLWKGFEIDFIYSNNNDLLSSLPPTKTLNINENIEFKSIPESNLKPIEISSLESLISICNSFMENTIDTTEVISNIIAEGDIDTIQLKSIIEIECDKYDNIRIKSIDNGFISNNKPWINYKLYIRNKTLIPSVSSSEFWIYKYPLIDNKYLEIQTREKSRTSGPGVAGLLSNITHGIDNTGIILTKFHF